MTAAIKAGSEVDTMCNRCELVLAHTVIAVVGTRIARVRCNTCQTEHAFRDAADAKAKAARARRKAEATPKKVVISFAERIASKPGVKPKPYSPKLTFAVDEVVEHPTFGLGIVSTVRGDKIDVAFKAFEKTLAHGRGGPAVAAASGSNGSASTSATTTTEAATGAAVPASADASTPTV